MPNDLHVNWNALLGFPKAQTKDSRAAVLRAIAAEHGKPQAELVKRYAEHVMELCELAAFEGRHVVDIKWMPKGATRMLRDEGFNVSTDTYTGHYKVTW